MSDDELKQILDNAPIVFGLKAQGHVPAIERILAEAWEKIGNEIGWCPKTAREHYERHTASDRLIEAEREIAALRAELLLAEASRDLARNGLARMVRMVTPKGCDDDPEEHGD
jgi:hypothetical protein